MAQTGIKPTKYVILGDFDDEVMEVFMASDAEEAKEIRAELGYTDYPLYVEVKENI